MKSEAQVVVIGGRYAIRFRRPIPPGTVKGADVGWAQWEQEPAYLLS